MVHGLTLSPCIQHIESSAADMRHVWSWPALSVTLCQMYSLVKLIWRCSSDQETIRYDVTDTSHCLILSQQPTLSIKVVIDLNTLPQMDIIYFRKGICLQSLSILMKIWWEEDIVTTVEEKRHIKTVFKI